MAKKKNKGGRPTKYYTHVEPRLIEIEGWARDGLIDEQIAHNLGVAYSTFREYKKQFPALAAALKRGKDVVDREVENALLKRALGYEYKEVTEELINGQLQVTKVVTKQVPPDTTAQIFWLKNRKPDVWRDRHEVGHSGELNVNNPFKDLSVDELKKLVKLTSDNK